MAKIRDAQLREDILNHSIWRLMARLSLPAVLGMSLGAINNFIDALYVGRFIGQNGLAAISLVFPLTIVTSGFASMIGVGASTALSRAIGARDIDVQQKILAQLLMLSLVISAIISLIGFVYARELIHFLGGDGEVLDLAVSYYRVMVGMAVFRITGIATNMLIRSEGRLNKAMAFASIVIFLNMMVTPVFILVLDMGIAGAAWGTISSMIVYCFINIGYFVRGHSTFAARAWPLTVSRPVIRQILGVGVSAMMLQIMFFVQQVFTFKSVAWYGGDRDIALMGVCYRVFMVAAVPVWGLVQAFQPVAGINFGARQYTRVIRAAKTFASGGTLAVLFLWIPIIIFPDAIVKLLLPDFVLSEADRLNFRIILSALPGLPLFFVGVNLLQSIAFARLAAILLISRQVVLFIPVVLILPLFFGINGIYWSTFAVDFTVLFIMLMLMKYTFSRLRSFEQQPSSTSE